MTKSPPTIAVFTKNRSNPAYAAARLGADRTAQRLGARTVHYVPEKPDDADEQIALIELAMKTPPDAVVLVPVHPTAINGSIRDITAAGVPLIGFLNRFSESGPITFVGADDYAIGVRIASYVFDQMKGRGDVVLMEGVSHSVTSIERMRGFRDAAAHYPDTRIVATVCGRYLREPSREVGAGLLASRLHFDAVIAANDEMALGMLDALHAAPRPCVVAGVNAIPAAITAIREGRLLATADFNALKISEIATEAALRHLRGEPVPSEIILPVDIVDGTNSAQWDMAFEQRPPARWSEAVASAA